MFDALKKILRGAERDIERSSNYLGLSINVLRYWLVVCTLLIVVFLGSFFAEYYLFFSGQGLLDKTPIDQLLPISKLDVVRLGKIVDEWKQKETKFNDLLGKKPVIIDPSL